MLLVGGGHADIPLILAAKKLGFYVITTGNHPDSLGHSYADEYQFADFSDVEAIFELAKRNQIDAVCPSCNDFAALAAAYTAEKLNLPGFDSYETMQIIHHKDEYRKFALANNIRTPKAQGFSEVATAKVAVLDFPLPCIIKPVDLSGGKGITVIHGYDQANEAIDQAFSKSKSKRIVIEQFLTGSKHGFSAFISQQKVIFYFVDNEHYFLNPYMVSAASVPSNAPQSAVYELIETTERIASTLSLKDGIFHVQFIMHHNKPYIIEICRRSPGDLYIKFVEHATTVDYPSWIVKSAAGIDCRDLQHINTNQFMIRHCIMPSKTGRIKNVVFSPWLESRIIDRLMWWREGDCVEDILTHKFGIIFVRFQSLEEMLDNTESLHERISIEYH